MRDGSDLVFVFLLLLMAPLVLLMLFFFVTGDVLAKISTAIVFLALAAGIAVHVRIWRTYHYICPACSTSFKPTFTRSFAAVNCFELRGMTCTKCGRYDMMEALKDKSDPGWKNIR
ncbi:MAG: hypothetical protein LBB30_00865 [Candidatus Methanoplasma sp.]|jgi:hypothetical protein|nr:hypothetical protein [Candidatus Methanoplasma sp.]